MSGVVRLCLRGNSRKDRLTGNRYGSKCIPASILCCSGNDRLRKNFICRVALSQRILVQVAVAARAALCGVLVFGVGG